MVGHRTVQRQSTEPAIGKVEVNFFAEAPLRTDAEAVAHQQHPDHQLGINREATRLAVVGSQMCTDAGQVNKTIDRAQQMIHRHMLLKTEAVEERLLHHSALTHHRVIHSHRPLPSLV